MKKNLGLSLFCLMVSFAITPNVAQAQDIAPQPCDTEYWESLTSRAWLEAEREIMQNQNLIFKADSVLEYTCFDRFSQHNAEFAGAIFSDEDGVQRLDAGLLEVVHGPLEGYILDNFGHLYLGGRAEEYGADPIDRFIDFVQPYACEEMAGVWQAAKCANLLHTELFSTTDGFYPFVDLAGFEGSPDVAGYTDFDETRLFPLACGGPDVSGRLGGWIGQHIFAVNEADILYGFHIPLGLVYEDVAEKLDPALCLDPILTGVEVITSTGRQGDDGVCTNPGCTYVGGGCEP